MKTKLLFNQLGFLITEQENIASRSIDALDVKKILHIINAEDQKVARVVKNEIPYIARAVAIVVRSLKLGGRLLYVGAGTSGRLGILDAAECPPTFGSKPNMIQGLIAGGKKSVFRSQEGAEDRAGDGIDAIRKSKIGVNDVVCGIAASMRTPFVVAALSEAKRKGAQTIFVTTNSRNLFKKKEFRHISSVVDVAICAVVGPEVITGSTRMKAGTAQKLVLNMLTTASMIQIGKVYKNMMVDLKLNSKKLEERAKRILMATTDVDYPTATDYLLRANGHVKTALVMIKKDVSASEARRCLTMADGHVRKALDSSPNPKSQTHRVK